MRTLLSILYFLLILTGSALAQNCLPVAIHFQTQAQIDAFPISYPACTEIGGNVLIKESVPGDITNLQGLAAVETIGGGLKISDNTALTDLHGLEGITAIGESLIVQENASLISLNGLDGLGSVGGHLILQNNPAIASLESLLALTSIDGQVRIANNGALTSLDGLDNIAPASISNLKIIHCAQLSECDMNSICSYLSDPANPATISGNATGCASRPEVEVACGEPLPCPIDLTLSTQAEIDAFPTLYPGCTVIDGNLTIDGAGIVDLSPLMQLTEVKGDLNIGSYLGGTSLADLTGLNNLFQVGEAFRIIDNDELLSLNGLQSLTQVGANPGYDGDGLEISHHDKLTDLSALSNLISTTYLAVRRNKELSSLNGLQSVATVTKGLDVSYNDKLVNMTGLNSITSVGSYAVFQDNPLLVSLTGLEGLQSVGTFLWFELNTSLASLAPLSNLTHIGSDLRLWKNTSLTDLSGLEGLPGLGGYLLIYGHDALTDISALSGIKAMNGVLTVENNDALPSLTGLDQIDPAGISNLIVKDNAMLSICSVGNLCDYLSNPGNPATISGNAPGCASRPEVEANCPAMLVSPNPAKNELLLDVSDFLGQAVWIRICDHTGVPIWQYRHEAQQLPSIVIDLRSSGIRKEGYYFVTCGTNSGIYSQGVLIQAD